MAIDKSIDSAQLDADLTSVANAIRSKGGTSAQLAFPADFVQAIEDIETGGGGFTFDDYIEKRLTGTLLYLGTSNFSGLSFVQQKFININCPNVTRIQETYIFSSCSYLLTIDMPELQQIANNSFDSCTALESVNAHNVTNAGGSSFRGCSSLLKICFPKVSGIWSHVFYGCASLSVADFLLTNGFTGPNNFANCSNLKTLIIRESAKVAALSNINNFDGTPFASGGSGGTIYIPKALYDHLGDGSSLDYKAATNWSTLNGYGTITWAQIEGSIYETQYGDGTPIPTT